MCTLQYTLSRHYSAKQMTNDNNESNIISLTESFKALKPEVVSQLQDECAKMSQDFSDYQVEFVTELMTVDDLLEAMQNVAALGMQADVSEKKVQTILFDAHTGFLTTGIFQQPIYVAEFDGVRYAVSGRHRISAIANLRQFGLKDDTLISVVLFKPTTMGIAMSLVLTSNGSRSVSKGENSAFKLAKYGVLPDCNDCLRAGRDGTLSQSDAFLNAAWFSYQSQGIGDRTITTVQSIAKSFYANLKKMYYSYHEICGLLDDMLYCIEDAAKLTGSTNVARSQGSIAENIVEMLKDRTDTNGNPLIEYRDAPAKKQAKKNVNATFFKRAL